MNALRRIRRQAGSLSLPMLIALMFLLPPLLPAQNVPFTSNGIMTVTGVLPVYNGPYVIQQSDYGFFWLDTSTLLPGHVQAVSKCISSLPPSDSGLYILGDCNSITSISSSGNTVVARLFGGQCGAQTRGCGGPRDNGHFRFTFGLGTWDYKGDLGEIPDSTDTADPLGRTWSIDPTDFTGLNFVWHSSGIPNSPPFADAFGINLSAGDRADKSNYYGDKWQLKDVSSGATSVIWDFNYAGAFAADETGPKSTEGTVVGYFPCDPAGAIHGDIRSGANCRQSLGLTNPPAAAGYGFALRSANSFGTSTNTYISAALSVACPQASIAGYAGATGTCAKTGGTLTMPTGGNADARSSKGNLNEASFSWTFSFPSGPPATAAGPVVPMPNGASAFALTIAFPGGYQATASGAVMLTPSLVAAFSTQSPVTRGSPFILANEMEKAPTTTLNSVDSLINPGGCGPLSAMSPNPLASSFLAVGGLASVTAPNSVGSYCIYLRYNYTEGGSPASQIVSRPLTVTDWSPSPSIVVSLDSAGAQPAFFFGGTFYLTAGTSYYLFDEEPAPPADTRYPGAQWSLASPSGETALGSTATQVLGPVRFSRVCAAGCSLKLAVATATRQIAVNIASCASDATTLCVNGGRFQVLATWTTAEGHSGAGQAVALTADTGYFWFFAPGNLEIIVKVVDGREYNSRFWVFAGGLTDVDVVMTVLDTQTGIAKTYHNPQGTAFQPIQDTGTFLASATFDPGPDAASPFAAGSSASSEEPEHPASATELPNAPSTLSLWRPGDSSAEALCTANTTTLCLNKGRFTVQVQWTTPDGTTGAGQAVFLTGDTGYFWFFNSDNVEMVVKVLNGCGYDSSYWTFAGGLTDIQVVMTVTDTQTGATRAYTNPQRTAFQPIQDTSAFASCP